MYAVLRAVIVALSGMSLLVGSLAAMPAAAAQPPPAEHRATGFLRPDDLGLAPTPSQTHRTNRIEVPSRVSLSAIQWRAAGYVTRARNTAVSSSGKTMNYRKMKRTFGTKSRLLIDWRRQMAAAHKQTGGRTTFISKAEAKLVERRRKQMYGSRPIIRPRSDVPTARSAGLNASKSLCRGRSGDLVVNRNESHKYYNSCETVDLKYYWGGCIGAMAFLGRWTAKDPRIDSPRYFIAAFCAFELAAIQRAADKSEIGAIYLRIYQQEVYQPYPGGVRYFISYTLQPQ